MSRSGYSDDCEYLELFRASVDRAIHGKRGQAFLRDLMSALDAMPEKRLIAENLEHGADVCALGCVGRAKGINMVNLDPENPRQVSMAFGIATALTQEITFINDDEWAGYETPELRWVRVRTWVAKQIKTPI